MSFIRFNGWGLKDISNFLNNAGARDSYGSGNDNNGYSDDPIFKPAPLNEENIDMSFIKAEFDKAIVDNKYFVNSDEKIDAISTCIVASTLELAKHMTHKSVCVVFGRDMYPMQEAMRVFQHKLRGTWVYVEGASRGVTQNGKFQKAFAAKFGHMFDKADVIYAVDTGYSGSVPEYAIVDNESFSKVIREKTKIRLICYNRTTGDRHLFQSWIHQKQIDMFKEMLTMIEWYPKPILRSGSVDQNGWPIIHVSSRVSILASAILMNKVREESLKYLSVFSLYMDEETDVGKEFWGHLPEFATTDEAVEEEEKEKVSPATPEQESVVIELFGIPDGLVKSTCMCGYCNEEWDKYINKKLQLLGGK